MTKNKPYESKSQWLFWCYTSKQNYYSLRRGEVGRGLLLKIVTEKNKDGTELIDTVFTTNKISICFQEKLLCNNIV